MTNPTPHPDSPEVENLAQQLHVWYLEATKELNPESYNPNAQKAYDDMTEEQKFIDRFIAAKLSEYYTNKFLEIVGEDEPASASVYKAHYRDNRPTDTLYSQTELQINNEIAKGRNQIRAELRQAIKQLQAEDKES